MIPIVGCLANVISGDSPINIDSVMDLVMDSVISYDVETLKLHLREEIECEKSLGKLRPIHDNKIWAFMREKYDQINGISESSSNESSPDHVNGFKIKYSVSYKNNRRTILAEESIKEGEVVYQHRSMAKFPDFVSFICFLKEMPTHLLCDTIDWFYEYNEGTFVIDFDDMSYINDEGEMNIDYADNDEEELVALHDINVGEELMSYNDDDDDDGVDNYYKTRFDNEDSTAGILRELNNCEEVEKKKRPIFGKPLWILMQKIYEDLTNETMSSDDFGFRVKYSVNHSKFHGRGLYARENIQEGEIVYEHKRDTILTPETYPEFLNRLALQENKQKSNNQHLQPYLDFLNISPAGVICDMQMWTYGRTKTLYNLDLDDMVYCNSATPISGANIDYSNEEGTVISATRNIDAGEEMLCNYEIF